MFGRIRILKHERGLWFRHGDFHRLLGPGKYRIWSRLIGSRRDVVTKLNTLQTIFVHPLRDVLVAEPDLRRDLLVLDLSDNQRALIWKDGRLEHIAGPGRHTFWKTPYELKVETYEVEQFKLEHARLESILSHADAGRWLQGVDVQAHEEVLLFRDGEPAGRLAQGRYAYWKGAGKLTWITVDKREQLADVAGQEIMTKDKVTLRVNLLVTYQVTEPKTAVMTVSDYAQALYREAQLALRAAVGTRLLDTLLSDKEALGSEVARTITQRAAQFGVTVRSVGLRDIILPGEMKLILNQVIEAQKQAEANLIRRREETAAARSQANTARLLAENPTLARIKEMETVAEILAGTRSTFIFGQGELVDQVRGLIGGASAKDD